MAARVAKILVPLFILAMGLVVFFAPYSNWGGVEYLGLAAALAAFLVGATRGWLRSLALVAASLLVGLAAVEASAVLVLARPNETRASGYSGNRPILGWGAQHPGIFRNRKFFARSNRVIYDAHYTIDDALNRKVISAPDGPLVAFFGDSFVFGTGLDDNATLPQIFSDLYRRKLGVTNFGFPGYGPQQFLRALETKLYDKQLRGRVKLFVYETAAFHVTRAACIDGFMLRAPRYVLESGRPVFRGTCAAQGTVLAELFRNTAMYQAFIEPVFGGPRDEDIDLYVAILAQAAALARVQYGAPTIILYIRDDSDNAKWLRHAHYNDEDIIAKMRGAGLDVLDVTLDLRAYPGKALIIVGDGHPSGFANGLRAAMLKAYLDHTRPSLLTAAQ
ncbi:SGNH/GDSL hydrolase family protein [uncultured Methylovirgula sp.]|uniref:SGNH/GDSL hydrolase family protein n=1 Tax=uncultured Methylovirgula sp. TaxID=1285960 RepID=UPI0026056EC3|nr:SGNH/GDSL hydrolase family protein [uncultured Methylovirgula sp.]